MNGDQRRTIWLRPRQTLRALIDAGDTQYVWPLAALAGAAQELINSFYDAPSTLRLIFDLLGGALFGALLVALGSALILWAGLRLGGAGDWQATRLAVAWAGAPYPVLIGVLVLLQLLYNVVPDPAGRWQLATVRLVALTAHGYALGLLLINVSEALRLPLWKAALVALLPAAVLLAPFVVAALLVL